MTSCKVFDYQFGNQEVGFIVSVILLVLKPEDSEFGCVGGTRSELDQIRQIGHSCQFNELFSTSDLDQMRKKKSSSL